MRLRTVSPVSVSLLAGVPAFLFGLIFGVASWAAGIVMLAALPLLIGFELILQAIVLDVQNVSQTVIRPPFPEDGGAPPHPVGRAA